MADCWALSHNGTRLDFLLIRYVPINSSSRCLNINHKLKKTLSMGSLSLPPFSSFSFSEKRLIYQGLLALVNNNSGCGFCNNDQGHPAYAIGRKGEHNYQQWGDSPEHNKLFNMMHTLSVELNAAEIDGQSEISEYVFSWQDFCILAYGAHERQTARA